MCGLMAQKCAQNAVIRYCAALCRSATESLLNCRAIRPHDSATDSITLVERNLDHAAICARIGSLDPLIFLRLQQRGSRHAEESRGDKNAGDEEAQKGEGFHHLVCPMATEPLSPT
jgi:hypothetical protein